MAIERWDPFREMVNAFFQEPLSRPLGVAPSGTGVVPMPLDVSENEHNFVIKASLPGVKPEDVQVTIHGDILSIRGETKAEEEKKGETWHLRERRYGSFQRSISLGTPISTDKAEAKFDHGVLTLTLPKAEEARPKQIKVSG